MLVIDGRLLVEGKHVAFCRCVVCKISFSFDTSGIQMALQVTVCSDGDMDKAGAKKSQPKARNGGPLDHGSCRCCSRINQDSCELGKNELCA